MELDKIKELWNEVELLKEKQHAGDERVKEMLKNKGKTALSKLITLAKIGMIAIIPLGIFGCFYFMNPHMVFGLIFALFCAIGFPFEVYGYRLLKSIDYSNMAVTDVLDRILKYQKFVRAGEKFGLFFFASYMGTWSFFRYKQEFGLEIHLSIIIFLIAICLLGLIGIFVLYKKLYYNRLNQIKESLKELKEFEKSDE